MINNSPRSGPAASSATSKPATARSGSPNCTGSPTRPRPPPPSPCVTAEPEALGFYLDRRRVHVGDPTTTLDAVFNAWQNDRSHGLDAIMLAPTRELVRSLNQRARDHRLADTTPGRQVELADGNRASVGDLIITRSNDRRLRTARPTG